MAELQGQDPDNRESGSFRMTQEYLTNISPWSRQWPELELQRYEFVENGRTARRSVGDIHPPAQTSPLDIWCLINNPGENSNSEPRTSASRCTVEPYAPPKLRLRLNGKLGEFFCWNRIPLRMRPAISECLSKLPRSQCRYKHVQKFGLIAHLSIHWRSC